MRLVRLVLSLCFFLLSALELLGLVVGEYVEIFDVINNFLPLLTVSVLLLGIRFFFVSGAWMRLVVVTILVVALVFAGIRMLPEYNQPMVVVSDTARADFKVLTHNVSVSNRDVGITESQLLTSGADVLVLQETDGTFAGGTASIKTAYPYATTCLNRCSLRIFSKRPILRNRYRLRDAKGQQIGPALIWAETTAPDETPVTIVSLHYPWPVPVGAQVRQREALAQVISGRDDIIIAGDMNLTPWTSAMRRQDAIWQPLSRVTRATWSWPTRVGGFSIPFPLLPIDQIYASRGWQAINLETLAATGSDHYPVMVTFRRAAAR